MTTLKLPSKVSHKTLILSASVVLAFAIFPGISNHLSKSSAQTVNYPMDLINSKNWKITLPIDDGKEIKVGGDPDLITYSDEWFHLNDAGDGVVFKARTDGETTSGSSNPRSELREMKNDGRDKASWSSTSGNHSMIIEQSVDALPIGDKPVAVAGQIHDSEDDVTVFRIEANTYSNNTGDDNLNSIWITDGDTSHRYLITNSYELGTKFTIGFKVSNGQIKYVYNGEELSYTKSKSFSGGYFKAGAYNQSGGNCTEITSGPDAGECDYAQVTIYALQVCHDGVCKGTGEGPISNDPPTTPTPPVIVDDAYDVTFANLKTDDYTKPTNLKWELTSGNPASIKLSWKAAPGEDDATVIGYKLYEKTSTSDYKYILISTNLNSVINRTPGSYSYKISAVYQNDEDGSFGESKFPSSVSLTVK